MAQAITEKSITDAAAWVADPKNIERQKERLEEARRHIILDFPFLGDKAMRAVIGMSLALATAGTDGKKIDFNPLFCALLTLSQLIFVTCHEMLHLSLGHHVRRNGRDLKLWNMACDYVVNRILVRAGLVIPSDALFDRRFDGMSEEEICSVLEQESNEQRYENPEPGLSVEREGNEEDEGQDEGEGQGEGQEEDEEGEGEGQGEGQGEDEEGEGEGQDPSNNGAGGYTLPNASEWGEVSDMTNEDGTGLDDSDQKEELVKQAIENETARRMGDMIGDGGAAFSDSMGRAFEKSRYSWEDELREFVQEHFSGDPESTWSRGWRPGLGMDIYLPGYKAEGMSRILIAQDASLSVWNTLFDHGLSQIEKIVNNVEVDTIDWLQFDDEVVSVKTFEYGARFENPTRDGAGGTVFQPVLDWIKESGNTYDCIIVLTDMGLCDWHTLKAPQAPVIWCDVYGNSYEKATFGRTILVTE